MRSLLLPWRTAVALVAALVAPASVAQTPARAVPTEPTATFLGLPTAESFRAPSVPMAGFGADLLNETFTDTTFPAAGWTLLHSGGSGTYADWRRETGLSCTSNPCTAAYFSGPLQDRYLVTPQVTPTVGGSTLTFRSAQAWAGFPSEYHVMVSTTTPTVGAFTDVAVYDQTAMPTGTLSSFSVDLSAYIGMPIYLAFMHRQNNGNLWMLDDVRIAQSTPAAFAGAGLAYQNRGIVSPGWRMWAVAANVFVSGDAGSVTVNRLTFDTAGTTDVADLTLAQLYYTGAGTTIEYGTTPMFGSNIGNPNGEMTFLGHRTLPPGNNHFVLVYWTNSSATPGNRLDATFTGAMVGGEDHTPAVRSLTGALSVARSNDALADARVVDAASYSYTDSNQSATAEDGEAVASCVYAYPESFDSRQSLWYAYTPLASGSATFSSTSGYDANLSVYTGTAFPLTEIACADGALYSDPESLTFAVTAGTTYYLRISGHRFMPTGTATVSVNGPAPAFGAFAFEQPTVGQQVRVGAPLKAIWDSPSAPVASSVNLYLRTAAGAETLIYSGANLQQPDFGAARYTIPTTTLAGTYTLRIEDADAPSRTATSAPFTIVDTDGRFEFTSPVGGESVAMLTPTPVTWTSPANVADGTVTLTVWNRDGSDPVVHANLPNTGSRHVTFDAGRSYLTIVSDQAPAYTGRSRNVRADVVASAEPTAGASFAVGEVLPVRWTALRLGGFSIPVDITLMHPVHGNRRIGTQVASYGQAYDYTLPADIVPDDGYVVRLRYSGASGMRSVRSGAFSITGGEPRLAAAPHFVRPASWGTDGATLIVAAPGLADGAEVGAFAGSRLVGTGLVAGGVAEVTVGSSLLVPALVAGGRPEADDFVYLADDTPLALRAFADGVETDLATEAPVAYVAGTETEVVATGAAGAAPSPAPAALAVEAYPNPATTRATVRFAVPDARPATVTVYDLLGRTVATPFAGEAVAGHTEVAVPTQALPAGVYLVRVVAGTEVSTTRLTVVR